MKHMIISLACIAYFAGAANAQATQPVQNPLPSAEPKQATPADQHNKTEKNPQEQVKAPKEQTK